MTAIIQQPYKMMIATQNNNINYNFIDVCWIFIHWFITIGYLLTQSQLVTAFKNRPQNYNDMHANFSLSYPTSHNTLKKITTETILS